ncbi:hypothetical protein ACOMHN_038688 [Nucella lapillus]
MLTLHSRTDGVALGLLLSLLFWGGLLLRCGDVEQNPEPPRQARLSDKGRSISVDRSAGAAHDDAPDVAATGGEK